MNLFSALAKHGTAVVAGFLLGLLAVEVVQPVTANGRVLLIVVVMCIAVLAGELILLFVRRFRSDAGKGEGDPRGN